uniref:Putative secreted protein n=1 Tax=Xenopsylla cheopis TaxID=163159 RepID=A0A6M2DZ00_XENCH
MYKFRISLRSLQSTPIALSLLQLTLSNAFFHSMKHAHFHRDIFLILSSVFLYVPSSSTFFEAKLILSYVLVYLVLESSVKDSGHHFFCVR